MKVIKRAIRLARQMAQLRMEFAQQPNLNLSAKLEGKPAPALVRLGESEQRHKLQRNGGILTFILLAEISFLTFWFNHKTYHYMLEE